MTYHRRSGLSLAGLGAIPGPSQLGRIVARDGWSYQIVPDDVLWLARSVDCEGGNEAATIWTYAQRLANRHGSSLASLVRAHSQPVNPLWAQPGVAKCAEYPDRCTPAQIARRRECASKPWDALRSHALIQRWAQANVQNPVPRATDFADGPVSTSFMGRNPGTQVVMRDGNWYLAEGPASAPNSRPVPTTWPADFVTIQFQGRTAGVSMLAGVPSYVPWLVASGIGVAALGGVAAWTMKHPRRAA